MMLVKQSKQQQQQQSIVYSGTWFCLFIFLQVTWDTVANQITRLITHLQTLAFTSGLTRYILLCIACLCCSNNLLVSYNLFILKTQASAKHSIGSIASLKEGLVVTYLMRVNLFQEQEKCKYCTYSVHV